MTTARRFATVVLSAAIALGGVCALPRVAEPVSAEGEINVWLIGGQSNALGCALDHPTSTDERFTTGFSNVLFWGDYQSNLPLNESFVPVTTGLGNGYAQTNTYASGAELGIASALADSGEMHAVIKCAYGGTFLNPDTTNRNSQNAGTWTPPSWLKKYPQYDTGKVGDCYEWFLDTVREGLSKLEALGYTPVVRGMWWMQGEADIVSSSYTSAYAELLTDLISDLRADLGAIAGSDLASMSFVIGKIYGNPAYTDTLSATSAAGIGLIREAQQAVADQTFNAFTVDCTGLTQQDLWHFTADSQVWLGEQFIEKALSAKDSFQVLAAGSPFVTVTGGGIKTAGQSVSVEIAAKRGYRVTGATYREGTGEERAISLSGGEYTFTMPESNVYLSFETQALPLYTLTYTVNDAAMGSVYVSYPTTEPKGWYEGESVKIGVLPKAGYEIVSVTANGTALEDREPLGEGYVYTITQNANVSVQVTFAAVGEDPDPDPGEGNEPQAPEKKGCGGVIAGGGAIFLTAFAAGIALLRKKRG